MIKITVMAVILLVTVALTEMRGDPSPKIPILSFHKFNLISQHATSLVNKSAFPQERLLAALAERVVSPQHNLWTGRGQDKAPHDAPPPKARFGPQVSFAVVLSNQAPHLSLDLFDSLGA